MTARVPLADQIAEVERDIAQRLPAYAERVASGAMTQQQADERLPRIFAVLHTLKWLQRNEDKIKAMLKGQNQ